MPLTTKISPASAEEMVIATGKSKILIIEDALKSYRFHSRMQLLEEAYTRLQSDKNGWAEELKEREELEGTLMAGLEGY